jgi:DNA-binding response OmpR family regulator/pSer/pThr/pTyr-binding forkhead associated (FHA) protein
MSETPAIPWVIELYNPKMPTPLKIRLENRVIIGRIDKNKTQQPDIDLGPYGAEAEGVSRQHVALHSENDFLMVTDLQSGNGTTLNNVRLEANKPHILKNHDVLYLGRMEIAIRVIISPAEGSVFRKQAELQLEDQMHPGKGQFVLIVEDHPEVAKVFALILERAGYTVQICPDVVTAMRAFNHKRPSAMILDLMLPDMNGLELCRYVRRNIQRNTMPIVIVSAATTPDKVTEAIEVGADIFLGKPVSAKELRHVVSSLIYQHESGVTMLATKHLVGTAPLQAMEPESRRNSVVLFVASHSDTPITISIQQTVAFGRAADLPAKTYFDLSRFNAIDNGVSRIHMTLHNKDGGFYVEDNNSVNGTYLNGDPLRPHEQRRLNNSDEIRLGQLRMYIYFLVDKEQEEAQRPGTTSK